MDRFFKLISFPFHIPQKKNSFFPQSLFPQSVFLSFPKSLFPKSSGDLDGNQQAAGSVLRMLQNTNSLATDGKFRRMTGFLKIFQKERKRENHKRLRNNSSRPKELKRESKIHQISSHLHSELHKWDILCDHHDKWKNFYSEKKVIREGEKEEMKRKKKQEKN